MSRQTETHGYLALVQLLASAAMDRRLSGAQRNALAALARFAGAEGTCCVSLARLAALLDVTRQAVQKALRVVAHCGYLDSKRRWRATGAEGAKVWMFNLGLKGAAACPVVWPEGVQQPEFAGRCNNKKWQGMQPLEVAHKKPLQETNSEDTNACPPGRLLGNGSRNCKTAGMQGRRQAEQTHLYTPIKGQPSVEVRILDHNRVQRAQASGRLWAQWCDLDPGLELLDRIGRGIEDVLERALSQEIRKRGRGCAYVAGAVERATRGEITARTILSGAYR